MPETPQGGQAIKEPRRPCSQTTGSGSAARPLRSRPGSALIASDDSRPSRHSKQRQSSRSAGDNPAATDPLDGAPVAVSIEHTKPGSSLDEHLRREQTRALLDLLTDHARRQRSKGAKN